MTEPKKRLIEEKSFVPKKDYQTTSFFFVRKPTQNSKTNAHWAMFFGVERPAEPGKPAPGKKWIKVDLIAEEYRVLYHAHDERPDNFSGSEEYYSVGRLTVPLLYQLLSEVAKEKGVHAQSPYRGARGAGTEPRTYDCQDFVKAMLEKLKSYELKEDKDQSKHYQ